MQFRPPSKKVAAAVRKNEFCDIDPYLTSFTSDSGAEVACVDPRYMTRLWLEQSTHANGVLLVGKILTDRLLADIGDTPQTQYPSRLSDLGFIASNYISITQVSPGLVEVQLDPSISDTDRQSLIDGSDKIVTVNEFEITFNFDG